jgi:pimeloyl-ACP methyl ester carboxylesterase
MGKTILMLHGWPQPVNPNSLYYKDFEKWGYDVVAPEYISEKFTLTLDNIRKYIEKELNGRVPDVIMGISMGGLLAPQIARDYPKAKMILIATGPKLKPKDATFNLLIALAKNKRMINALNIVKILPKEFLFGFYGIVNPFKGNAQEKPAYMEDMKNNFKYMLSIPVSKEGEIADLISKIDNTELLKTLKNETLIFAGKNDSLMPQDPESELTKLLPNSRIVVSHGSHWDVISEPSFVEMKKFLSK